MKAPFFFKNKKFIVVAIGLLVGISAMALTLSMGDGKIGKFPPSEQNLGVQFKRSWQDGSGHAAGIVKYFGVPVWDNGQGLGSRMPNLMAQQTQSPFIFLGEILPVEYSVFFKNFLVLILALGVMNLTILSWSESRIYRRIIFIDVAVLGPYFLYTVRNDWFLIADQYCALCLIFAGFLNPVWYQNKSLKINKESENLVTVAFIYGIGILLTGHILFFQIGLISFAVLLILNFQNMHRILGKTVILLIVVLGLSLTIPQLLELVSQSWNEGSISHSSQPSIFDIFLVKESWVYQFQPLTAYLSASFQPLLRLINKSGPRTEFFNFLLIPYILIRLVREKNLRPDVRRVIKTVVLASGSIFLCMMFFGSIARSGFPIISELVDFHIWQLSNSVLLLVTILVTILLGIDREVGYLSRISRFVTSIILPVALVMAVLYPIVMAKVETSEEKLSNSQNSLEGNTSEYPPASLRLEKNYRSYFMGTGLFENLFGDRNVLELQRAGFPSIDSVIYGRSSGTLRITPQRFRSYFQPSILDCRSKILDLLAINAIIYDGEENAVCKKNLENYYRSNEEISFKRVVEAPSVLSAKPRQFSSWSINTNSESNPVEPCPLFEKDCLSGLTVTKLEPNSGAPFKLCEDKCVFTYKWSAPSSSMQVLVPENYDKTIQIKDLSTGAKLKTASYQGLLAVEIPSGVSSGMFEATIKPDAMMWARVSATYIHTLILLSTLILISVRGVRARKERSDAVIVA